MLEYKGYVGVMKVEVDDGVIAGHTIGMRDVITFEGDTVPQAVQAFKDSVDFYLEGCAKRGKEPDRPFSGKLMLRLSPDMHKRLSLEASQADKSLNSLIVDVLAERFPAPPREAKSAEQPSNGIAEPKRRRPTRAKA